MTQPNRKSVAAAQSPLAIVAMVGLFILVGEFVIMTLIEGVLSPIFKGTVSATFWEFIDPVALTILVAPALYHWVLGPMRRQQRELHRQYDELCVAAATFETQAGVMVTDANRVILKVNHSFTELTGYTSEEAVGKTPAILKSGRQNEAFYRLMWEAVDRDRYWKGEIWNRRKSGEVFPESLTVTAVIGAAGRVINYVGIFSDIGARKAAEEEIKHLAFYDPLTHLPNRRLLLDRLRQSLAALARSRYSGALLFIDLDNFKTLNDSRGHDVGDQLLQQVARRLSDCVRTGDTVARLGGDEFVVLLADLSQSAPEAAGQTEHIGEKILDTMNQPYLLAGLPYNCTPSIGVTLFSDHAQSADELLKQADLAMYQAKTAGRNALRFFDPAMQAAVIARVALEADLREAIREKQFCVHYQAQVDADNRLIGAEALLRWQHPRRGTVPPAEFIPLAEEAGLIPALGRWVLETACAQLVAWDARSDWAHLTLSVNVSPRQFRQPDFVAQVLAALDNSGADPRRLMLELTENLAIEDVDDTIAKMTVLKLSGVAFSLDDFGTGYSSLFYLKRLPLDQLKIDQSFVRNVLTDANDAAIARTIIALTETLGLAVIAEGVETAAQRAFLADQGCNAYQGYLFGRAVPVLEFEETQRSSSPLFRISGDRSH
jgi:diguanylate cyclase (GGDEF)-like protein/PAS domain S-box-containing protein